MNSTRTYLAALAGAFLLGGCAYNHPPGAGDYYAYQAGGEQSVRFGVVDSVRPVRINPGDTGIGGIIGSNIEHDANTSTGVEITVLLDSGQYVAIVQAADEPFRPGDRVRVVGGHGHSRVTH